MSPKCILVIDDEYAIQLVVRGCLEDLAGWNVITASSGREGLAKAQTEHPDAILLDVMMPEMDGIALLQKLRASPETESIPVVFLTAKMEFTDFNRLPICGVVGTIAKPFDSIELVEKIAGFLNWEIAISEIASNLDG